MTTLTTITHALSDINRVRLLVACMNKERCVCQLVELIDLSNASISKHLGVLKQAGLLESRKEGRWVHYQTPVEPNEIIESALCFVRSNTGEDELLRSDQKRLKTIDEIEPAQLARMQRQGCCVPLEAGSQGE